MMHILAELEPQMEMLTSTK